MNILITGGSGFIGSNLIRYVLRKYQEIRIINVDKITSCSSEDTLKDIADDYRYTFIKSDIFDFDSLENIFINNKIDTVIHMAAESFVDKSIIGADDFMKTNIIGTYNLLKLARKYNVGRFYYQGTDEEYGHLNVGDSPFVESSKIAPRNIYSATKASASHLCMSYYHTFNLPIIIGRLSNCYGPYQYKEKFIPSAITNLINGDPISVYGVGENIRDWLYVEDACDAIDKIIHFGSFGEVYNVGGECERKNIYIAELLCKTFGISKQNGIKFVEDRMGHDFRYSISYEKISKEFGWFSGPKIEDRISGLVNWYIKNEWWWRR